MTRGEFLRAIQTDGIRDDAFTLCGDRDESYVLLERGGYWDVYYSERGLEERTRRFQAESEAFTYLLEVLRADSSTRI